MSKIILAIIILIILSACAPSPVELQKALDMEAARQQRVRIYEIQLEQSKVREVYWTNVIRWMTLLIIATAAGLSTAIVISALGVASGFAITRIVKATSKDSYQPLLSGSRMYPLARRK